MAVAVAVAREWAVAVAVLVEPAVAIVVVLVAEMVVAGGVPFGRPVPLKCPPSN